MGLERTEESLKREEALPVQAQSFEEAGQDLPVMWMDKFLAMWNNPECKSIPEVKPPPKGWLKFNESLGGVPWHGAWSHSFPGDEP